jgi:hypothetical protein
MKGVRSQNPGVRRKKVAHQGRGFNSPGAQDPFWLAGSLTPEFFFVKRVTDF